jgi:hypothetical protein
VLAAPAPFVVNTQELFLAATRMADKVAAPAASFVSVLPHALALNIYARLRLDERARCACVCRGWCTAVHDAALWTRLDLSASSGVKCAVNDAVLRGASGLARGSLAVLDVSDCKHISHAALLAVVVANAGALRKLSVPELRTEASLRWWHLKPDMLFLEEVLLAAPNLSLLRAGNLVCASKAAQPVLRNEPPYGPLRARSVCVEYGMDEDNGVLLADNAPVHDVLAGVADHAPLRELELVIPYLDTHGLIATVVDVVLSPRFQSLTLFGCCLSTVCVPPLARRLRDGALTKLSIREYDDTLVLLDAPTAALLCDALRANATLTSLELGSTFWTDAAISVALLGAVTAHASLRHLYCEGWFNEGEFGDAAADVGAALAALVAANTPALMTLSLVRRITDAGVGPLLDALPGNTRLFWLDISNNNMSAECARDRLLPAVRASTSLTVVRAHNTFRNVHEGEREAEALAASRRAPRGQLTS